MVFLPNQKRHEAATALTEQHLEEIYDLILQVYGQRDYASHVWQKTFKTAHRRFRTDRWVKYSRLWILRICVERISSHYNYFLSEQPSKYVATLAPLNLEEKLCLLLRYRCGLSQQEIAAVMQLQEGRVGRSLVYACEHMAKVLKMDSGEESWPLPQRTRWHFAREQNAYCEMIKLVSEFVAQLPRQAFAELSMQAREIGLVSPPETPPMGQRWQDLPWKTKLTIEGLGVAAIGAVVVLLFPWVDAHVNASALWKGNFERIVKEQDTKRDEQIISTDRLIAESEAENRDLAFALQDEFSGQDFPSGDAELGTAPVAPSRQNKAVYRLIINSPNPSDLSPEIKKVFADRQVKERELSGRRYPGGIFFDGVITQDKFPLLLRDVESLKQVGKSTRTYGNSSWEKRDPSERARVIIWIQQI